jgi:hypothetical protein
MGPMGALADVKRGTGLGKFVITTVDDLVANPR